MPPQTQEQLNKAERGAKELGFESVAKAREAISPENLQPETPINVTQPDPSTAGAGLEGAIEAETNAFTENLQKEASVAEKSSTQSLDSLVTNLLETPTESQLTATAMRKSGADDIQKELNDINQQIRVEQNALRREVERLQDAGGMSPAQQQNRIDEARRKSLRTQADLSVIQLGVQGRFDSAKAIADRAVNAQLERQDNINKALALTYQNNKDLFDKKEQRAFESALADRNRKIEDEKEQRKAISDFSIQAMMDGAPTSVVQAMLKAETREEALSLGGSYIGSLDRAIKQRQYQKLGLEIDTEAAKIKAAQEAKDEGVLTPEQFKVAVDLRKEVNNLAEVKDAKNLEPNMASLLVALDQENGVGDISAINTFQRLAVDPGVAVREGDVALLQSAQSFTDQATLRAKGLLVGDKLTDEARKQMREIAKGVYKIRVELVDENTQPIRTMAQEQGIDYGKYIGKNFASFEELESRVNKDDALVFGVNATTDDYVDDIFTTLSESPTANPFGVNLNN